MRRFALPLLLAGCAAVDPSAVDRGEAQLARELSGRTAGEARACVPAVQGRSLQAVNERTLVYRTGEAIWVNRLEGDCPGLHRYNTLVVETFGDRYCRGDLVRGLEPSRSIPGPRCPLNQFIPYRR